MRVAYFVSRFPHVSETFIVRELDAVREAGGVEIELFSLFPAVETSVHPAAQPWSARLHRGDLRAGLVATAGWFVRRPVRLGASVAVVCASYWRRPTLALRALTTIVIACHHARRLSAVPVDHVHAHYATYPALAAWLCHRLLGLPYSFTAHAHDLYIDQSMLTRRVADARFVVTISAFNRRFLRDYAGGPAGTPVYVVHCGIDPRFYSFRPRAAPLTRSLHALCVASLQEYKGHRVLFAALVARPELSRLHVDLVGTGNLRDSLERLAARLGIADRIHFEGSRSEQEVRDRLDHADLFVLASIVADNDQMEGLPVSLMEALACGIPVVATRLSGIPELVVDGETGLLADPGDVDGLADALVRTVADGDAALRRAALGRARVVEDFDIRETGARMAALFRSARSPEAGPGNP